MPRSTLAALCSIIFATVSDSVLWSQDFSWTSLPDFSHAGYEGGGVPIPDNVPVKSIVYPRSGDASRAIQDAISAVAALPRGQDGFRGTVLLKAGVYRINAPLNISKSGIVFRGEGESRTIIEYAGPASAGQAFFVGGGIDDDWKSILPGTLQRIASPLVELGAYEFAVDDASGFSVGDEIVVWHEAQSEWFESVEQGGVESDVPWEDQSNWRDARYRRIIEKIDGDLITVDAPMFMELDASLANLWIYRYKRPATKERIGLEDFTLKIITDGPNAETHVKHGFHFRSADNSWAKRVTVKHFWGSGFRVSGCVYTTFEDCKAVEPHSIVTHERRYNFNTSGAQLILFKNCFADNGRHAFVSNGHASDSGIVFLDCESSLNYGTSESHNRWATGLLFDNMVFTNVGPKRPNQALMLGNRGDHGNAHGWSAANSVAWRCDVTQINNRIVIQDPPGAAQNYAIGCLGEVTGDFVFSGEIGYVLEPSRVLDWPRSLYEAQLEQRLIKERDVSPPTPPSNFTGEIRNGNAVHLNWKAATDNTGIKEYLVYRDNAPIGKSETSSFVDVVTNPGSEYAYFVRAVDAAENFSADSEVVVVSAPPDASKPSVPKDLRVNTKGPSSVSLVWTPSVDDFGVAFYRVFLDGVESYLSAQSNVTVGGLTANRSYSLSVSAVDWAGGQSLLSQPVIITTPATRSDPNMLIGLSFDDSAGGVFSDHSQYGRTVSQLGSVSIDSDGIPGEAANFRTGKGRLDLGEFDVSGSKLTIAAWIKPSSFSVSDARIVSKAVGVGEADHIWMLSTFGEGSAKMRFRLRTDGGPTSTLIGNAVIPVGVWTHVAATYDGAFAKLYINGVLDASDRKTGLIHEDSAVPVSIGDQPQGSRGFDGLIDDFRIYQSALTDGELVALMSDPLGLPEDQEAPTIPQGISASWEGDGKASLHWQASTDNSEVAGYFIFRDGEGFGVTSETEFVVNRLSQGDEYSFSVVAFDASGNQSSASSAYLLRITADGVPQIQNVLTNGSFDSDLDDWKFFSDTSGSAKVVSRDATKAIQLKIDRLGSNIQLYQDGLVLKPNTEYNLSFDAYSSSGNDLRVSLAKHSSPYTNYGLNRERVELGKSWSRHKIGFETQGFANQVANARLYFWLAQDARAGDVYYIDSVELSPVHEVGGDVEVPSEPVGLAANIISSSEVTLSWNPSTDNVGVVGYRVFQGNALLETINGTSLRIGGLAASTTYRFSVAAFDAAQNESSRSSSIIVDIPIQNEAPTAPTGLKVKGVGETEIEVSWNASKDDSSVVEYRVFRDGLEIGGTSVPSYGDLDLEPGRSYVYTVLAVDDTDLRSTQSSPARVSTLEDTSNPSAPTGLTGLATESGGVNLTWNQAMDNVGVEGYRVYRNGSFLGEVAETSFLDSIVEPGYTYEYRVMAFDEAGNESILSTAESFQSVGLVSIDPDLWLGMGFEEGAGSLVFDISPNQNDGVIDDPIVRVEQGRFGEALEFSGSGGSIDLENLDIPGNSVTFASWIYADSFSIHDARVFSKAIGVNEGDHFWMLSTIRSGGIKLRFRLKTDGGVTRTLVGKSVLQANTWIHVAGTFDGSQMRVYVNGQLDGMLSHSGSIALENSVPAVIGDQPQGGRSFDGLIDDVRIYRRALSEAELLQAISVPVAPIGLSDTEAPTVPGSLAAMSVSATGIDLSWQESNDNIEVLGYLVYRDGEIIGQSGVSRFSDSGLNPSTEYVYQVSAFDLASNESGLSEVVSESTYSGSGNILENGDLDSDLDSWSFYTNTVGEAEIESNGYAGSLGSVKVDVTRAGSNIQLFQKGVTLKPDTSYRLSFVAYSSSGRDLRVSLSEHSYPYTNYGLNRVRFDLSTGWQEFVIDFQTINLTSTVNSGRFYFLLSSDARASDVYWIDSIEIVEL